MSVEVRMNFDGPFIVENQEIAYLITATKNISDIAAIAIMTGGENILSLTGNGCSCLYGYHKQSKPSYCVDMDYDSVEIWITNNIADERTFQTTGCFKKWIYDYLTCYGWSISEVDEQDVTDVFLNKVAIAQAEKEG